jgi:hypothetical protein
MQNDPIEYKLTLSPYQRNNLLWLLNACGYPYGNGVEPFTMANTGDWLGEIALMLAKPGKDCVLDSDDQINRSNADLKRNIDQWALVYQVLES